ncbi:MAG: glucuronate isomerase, partial [bacterium]|nr:glucuronate isomerase [bacterium]
RVTDARANNALGDVLSKGGNASPAQQRAVANFVFWSLAEQCDRVGLPFDLMIGVNRGVYADGVFQGQDLYDSRVSLIQYRELFNAFPNVMFPVSVLASVTNQELVSYSWIFPNVAANGHWWYSNTPAFIEHDLAARLEAIPRTKQIGYYSDMYKLEFALPKFNMFKRILAKVLAERFVEDRGWSEERAVEFGLQVLRGNVETMFPKVDPLPEPEPASIEAEPEPESTEESDDSPFSIGAAAIVASSVGTEEPAEEESAEPDNPFAQFAAESSSETASAEEAADDSAVDSEPTEDEEDGGSAIF